MFEDNPIKFDNPAVNKIVNEAIDGVREGEKESWRNSHTKPERTLITKQGLDIIILKNPAKYQSFINDRVDAGNEIGIHELEGVVLAGLFHSFGHIFFDEFIRVKTTSIVSNEKQLPILL